MTVHTRRESLYHVSYVLDTTTKKNGENDKEWKENNERPEKNRKRTAKNGKKLK